MGRTVEGVLEPGTSPTSPPTPGTVSHSLPTDLRAVREARGVVQEVLGAWRAEEIFDDVVLVASELVANALRHGLDVDCAWPPVVPFRPVTPPTRTDPETLRISLVSTGSHVICAVTDPSGELPVRRTADPMAGSGRGLQLVESLSLCWGWTVLDGYEDGSSAGAVQGKSVWAIFPFREPGRRNAQIVGAA